MGILLKIRRILRLGRRQEGAAVVEFALCLIPLLLILGGIIDYGQVWYMQSVLGTASREGARYATRYQIDATTGARLAPSALSPSVSAYLTTNYASLLPTDASFAVYPGDDGYATGSAGSQVSVQVTALKHWFFLHRLIPGLTNPQTLTSTTVMTCE
jgi:Flp pilus assembly protein TadG